MYDVLEGEDARGPFAVPDLLARPGFGPESMVRRVVAAGGGASGGGDWARAAEYLEFALAFTSAALKPAPSAPRSGPPAPEPEPAAPAPLVLIVDDEEELRGMIQYSVDKEGYRSAVAVDALDAAAKMKSEEPSLIVLDLMMPGQSGYEFLRGLHASGHGRIPVVLMTGRQLDSSTFAMIREEKNVVEVLAKPFALAALVASLRRYLKTARASD